VLRIPALELFLERFYDYEPEWTSAQVRDALHLTRTARWDRGGQWVEVYERDPDRYDF
jgi:hypothetical protein